MARRFQSVALIGASGHIGKPILQALVSAQPAFASITVIARAAPPDPSALPTGVQVRVADFSSVASLTAALAGINAVVSAVPAPAVATQHTIIDAAVAAGVSFFVPSEFGFDSTSALANRDFPTWRPKAAVVAHLEQLRQAGTLDYACLFVGLFLDWGMEGFLLDVRNKAVELWDNGDAPIALTTVGAIGRAVVAILQGGAQGKMELRIKEITLSQHRLYELAVQALGGSKDEWKVTRLDTKAAVAEGLPYAPIKRIVADGSYESAWTAEEDDSTSLGLGELTEEDVVQLVKKVAATS